MISRTLRSAASARRRSASACARRPLTVRRISSSSDSRSEVRLALERRLERKLLLASTPEKEGVVVWSGVFPWEGGSSPSMANLN